VTTEWLKGETMHSMRKTGHRDVRNRRANNPLVIAMIALVPALALIAPTVASAGSTVDRIKQSGTLKLGIGPDTPLSSKDTAGNPAGFASDLCNRIADGVKTDLGVSALKVEFVNVTREEGVRAVADGKVDVLCAPTVPTSTTRKTVSYSIPVFASGVVALVRRDASDRLKDILSGRTPQKSPSWRGNADELLRDSTITVVKGTRAEAYVTTGLADLQLVPRIAAVDDYASGVLRVAQGRSNVFFGDRVILLDAVKRERFAGELQVLDRFFTNEALAFAVPRDDEDLRLVVDNALSKVFRSSDFSALLAKWFGVKPSDSILTLFRASTLPD